MSRASTMSRFTWKIEHFSRLLSKKNYSDVFTVDGYEWRVMIFPKGNNVDHLSMYLYVVDSAALPDGWSRHAMFSLSVVNQLHSKDTVRKASVHKFNARERDWGFTKFIRLDDIYDPNRGYIVNDTFIVEAEVAIHKTPDILYYEVLHFPLPELQCLKTLKVAFHHATKDEVVSYTIRLPKNSTVGDVINDLKTKVELSHPNAELRLLEVFNHMIYKIFPASDTIENINDQDRTLRAEEIPEEEKNLGPRDRLIHVYHVMKDPNQNQMQVQNFGELFLLVIHEGETLAEVKARIQKKLQVLDEEFSKWKFAFLSLGRPEYHQDSDVVFNWFQRGDIYGACEQYLGLEHSDQKWNANQTTVAPASATKGGPTTVMAAPNDKVKRLRDSSTLSGLASSSLPPEYERSLAAPTYSLKFQCLEDGRRQSSYHVGDDESVFMDCTTALKLADNSLLPKDHSALKKVPYERLVNTAIWHSQMLSSVNTEMRHRASSMSELELALTQKLHDSEKALEDTKALLEVALSQISELNKSMAEEKTALKVAKERLTVAEGKAIDIEGMLAAEREK